MSDNSGVFFDGFADKFDTIYDGKRNALMQYLDNKFRSDIFLRYRMTFDMLGDLNGKTLLDVGCGSGPYITQALTQGASLICGIDAAPNMLSLARERVSLLNSSGKVVFIEGYFPGNKPLEIYDYAVVMGVMDYISEPVTFLRELFKAISVSAILSFPSFHWFRSPVRKIRYQIRKCPVYFYTPESISSIMNKAGINDYLVHKIPGAGMDYVVRINK